MSDHHGRLINTSIRNDVPVSVHRKINAHDIRSTFLHCKGNDTAGGADLDDTLAVVIEVADIVIHACSQVEVSLHNLAVGKLLRMVKHTVIQIRDVAELSKYMGSGLLITC